MNYLSNAVKFTKQNGKIMVLVQKIDSYNSRIEENSQGTHTQDSLEQFNQVFKDFYGFEIDDYIEEKVPQEERDLFPLTVE